MTIGRFVGLSTFFSIFFSARACNLLFFAAAVSGLYFSSILNKAVAVDHKLRINLVNIVKSSRYYIKLNFENNTFIYIIFIINTYCIRKN